MPRNIEFVETIQATSAHHLDELVKAHIQQFGPQCNLNHIDVTGVTSMDQLFWYSPFNGDISKWNTANVVTAIRMFSNSAFNGDISKWNMGQLKFANEMFKNSAFAGDISGWSFAKPGPGNLTGAFYSECFVSDMPLLKTFGCLGAALHPGYAGSFRDEYTLNMAFQLFEHEAPLQGYLARIASQGLTRLHVEYLMHFSLGPAHPAKKPSWCPSDVFEQMKHEKTIGVALGLDLFDICETAYQRLKTPQPNVASIDPQVFESP